jgi:nitroreductase
MDAMQAILTRRSIRRYTEAPVSDDLITQLLEAAMSAPTAADEPWHFVVIRNRDLLECVMNFHPHAQMLKKVPVAILLAADPTSGLPGRWPLDCAAATENMLVAANALGLGACWVGIYPVEERIKGLRSLTGMPERLIPLCMVAVGFPAEQKNPPARFRRDRIHYDRW